MIIKATLCYLQEKGMTLMICSSNKNDPHYNGKWNGLGGKLNSNETPEECAKREIHEESNLTAKKLMQIGFLKFPQISKGDDWEVYVFVCSEFSGELKESKEGKLEWIKTSQILKQNLWEGDQVFLPYVFKKQYFTGTFFYKEGRLISHRINHPKHQEYLIRE